MDKKKKNNVFESVFFILLVVIGAYVILRSPFFEISQVVIQGNSFLTEEAIIAEADLDLGVNIFRVDLAEIAAEIEKVPTIKEAQVVRELPSTVRILVTERSPLGIISTDNGFVMVDQEGVCLQRTDSGTPGIPVITGIMVGAADPGDRIHNELLFDVLRVIDGFPPDLVSNFSEVNIEQGGQIKAYTLDHIQCILGQAEDVHEKGLVLAAILAEVRSQGVGVSYINITSVEKPAVMFK